MKKIKLEALANDLDPEEPELVLQTIQEELQALKEELGKSALTFLEAGAYTAENEPTF